MDQKGNQTVPLNDLRRSSLSGDNDSLVSFSNEEAAWGKYSSVKAGLYGDPLVELFMRPLEETQHIVHRPQPEILRGYYIREVIVRFAVKDFIEKNHGSQIVVLGAGYDTLYFYLKHQGLASHVASYVELDLPIVVAKKLYYYRRRQKLVNEFPGAEFPHPLGPPSPIPSPRGGAHSSFSLVPRTAAGSSHSPRPISSSESESEPRAPAPPADGFASSGGRGGGGGTFARPDTLPAPGRQHSRTHNASGGVNVHHSLLTPLSPTVPPRESFMQLDPSDVEDFNFGNYHLLACDLKAIEPLELKLNHVLDPARPTMLISECVLVYLTQAESSALLKHLVEKLPNSAMLLYEQVNMQDAFGRRMVQNVADRSGLTLNVEDCASVNSQCQRLLAAGFSSAAGATVHDTYNALPKHELARVSRHAPLDEANLQEDLFKHYAFVNATRGDLLRPAESPVATLASGQSALGAVLALDWK